MLKLYRFLGSGEVKSIKVISDEEQYVGNKWDRVCACVKLSNDTRAYYAETCAPKVDSSGEPS